MVIEQLSARGVRFGTERTESGELENPSPESGELLRRITGWADQVQVPPLNLETLGKAVNVDAISVDSLRTPAIARSTAARADSSRQAWEEAVNRLDPRPIIDSARVLVSRLNSANPLSLGLGGARELAGSARNTLTSVRSLESNLAALDSTVRAGVGQLGNQVQELADSREQDYRYATSLLQLPSLDSPDLSPNIFGGLAVARMERILYWLGQAERFLPPGLNPRRFAGSNRARYPGTTVKFPDRTGDPDFLIETADADLEIGGGGAGAGRYAAQLTGLTTQPTVYGEPLSFFVERAGAAVGPSDVSVFALLDHVGEEIRDSLAVRLSGVSMPSLDLSGIGASLSLGLGSSDMAIVREGDSLTGNWSWRSSDVEWTRLGASESQSAGNIIQDVLWRTVSALEEVEVEVRFSGSVRGPSLSIGSNIGTAVARSLRQQLGQEIDRAEQQVRAEVDRLVSAQVDEARGRVDALESEIEGRIGVQLEELRNVRAELERAIRRIIPGG